MVMGRGGYKVDVEKEESGGQDDRNWQEAVSADGSNLTLQLDGGSCGTLQLSFIQTHQVKASADIASPELILFHSKH